MLYETNVSGILLSISANCTSEVHMNQGPTGFFDNSFSLVVISLSVLISKVVRLSVRKTNQCVVLIRGYREVLDGRLCRPCSEQRPLVSNFTNVAIVKLCCHNFTQIANFMIFFVSTISYRPTDLSLLKECSKNISF